MGWGTNLPRHVGRELGLGHDPVLVQVELLHKLVDCAVPEVGVERPPVPQERVPVDTAVAVQVDKGEYLLDRCGPLLVELGDFHEPQHDTSELTFRFEVAELGGRG